MNKTSNLKRCNPTDNIQSPTSLKLFNSRDTSGATIKKIKLTMSASSATSTSSLPSLKGGNSDSDTDSLRQSPRSSFGSPMLAPNLKMGSISFNSSPLISSSHFNRSPIVTSPTRLYDGVDFLELESFLSPGSDSSQNFMDDLEESDSHKDGTEKIARQHVRAALSSNLRLASSQSDYTITLLLGWGGNGAVIGGKRNRDSKPVAIKLIYKRSDCKYAPTPVSSLPNEITIIQRLARHRNVIGFIEWFEDLECFYLVTERVESNWTGSAHACGKIIPGEECMSIRNRWTRQRLAIWSGASDLFSFIDINTNVPRYQRRMIFLGIAKGVAYMHNEHSITHGDIKEENVLLSTKFEAKLCDFGHARLRARSGNDDGGFERKVAFYGTRDMTAPELVLNLKNKCSSEYPLVRFSGFEADVWALGLLLYSMCTGTLGNEHKDFLAGINAGLYRRETYPVKSALVGDDECVDLLRGMLQIDPRKRMTMRSVVRHPFCRGK